MEISGILMKELSYSLVHRLHGYTVIAFFGGGGVIKLQKAEKSLQGLNLWYTSYVTLGKTEA